MITSLRGRLDSVGADYVIIDVGGVGFRVFMAASVSGSLGRSGEEVKIYTHLHVREDILALYGFTTPDELRLFETLLTVSGIGPKIGMGMLAAMNVEQLTGAIASGNSDLLTSVPGIGKKTASRLVLELKDKISKGWESLPASPAGYDGDVLAALIALGYSTHEAMKAIASLPPDDKATLEEKVKTALGYLGK
jgi:Holliday junction DNA helicase RuvA